MSRPLNRPMSFNFERSSKSYYMTKKTCGLSSRSLVSPSIRLHFSRKCHFIHTHFRQLHILFPPTSLEKSLSFCALVLVQLESSNFYSSSPNFITFKRIDISVDTDELVADFVTVHYIQTAQSNYVFFWMKCNTTSGVLIVAQSSRWIVFVNLFRSDRAGFRNELQSWLLSYKCLPRSDGPWIEYEINR